MHLHFVRLKLSPPWKQCIIKFVQGKNHQEIVVISVKVYHFLLYIPPLQLFTMKGLNIT